MAPFLSRAAVSNNTLELSSYNLHEIHLDHKRFRCHHSTWFASLENCTVGEYAQLRMRQGEGIVLEVEMKFWVTNGAALVQQLQARGALPLAERMEEDHYFNAPDRDFARTDEALRLRRIGSDNVVTYKGPKLDTQTKTRTELEVPLAPGDRSAQDFQELLTHLGYRPVAVVRKRRRVYQLEIDGLALEVCLDSLGDLGEFVELEIMAEESMLSAAQAIIIALASELGLDHSERRSYLELLLESQQQHQPARG